MQIINKFGETLYTPSIRISTTRKCNKDFKIAELWMLNQCKRLYKDNDYITVFLNCMNQGKLSQSDKDILFDLLLPEGHTEYIFELIEG